MTQHAGLLTWGIEHHQKGFVFLLQKPSQFLVNTPKNMKTDPRTAVTTCVMTLISGFIEHGVIHLREEGSSFLTARTGVSSRSILRGDSKTDYRFKYLMNTLDQHLLCSQVKVAWLGFFLTAKSLSANCFFPDPS